MIITGSPVRAIGTAYRLKGKAVAVIPVLGQVTPVHHHLIKTAKRRPETIAVVIGGDSTAHEEELSAVGADIIVDADSLGQPGRHPRIQLAYNEVPEELAPMLPDTELLSTLFAWVQLIKPHNVYLSETQYPLLAALSWAIDMVYGDTKVHGVEPLRDALGCAQDNLLLAQEYGLPRSIIEEFTSAILEDREAAFEALIGDGLLLDRTQSQDLSAGIIRSASYQRLVYGEVTLGRCMLEIEGKKAVDLSAYTEKSTGDASITDAYSSGMHNDAAPEVLTRQSLSLYDCFSNQALDQGEDSNEDKE